MIYAYYDERDRVIFHTLKELFQADVKNIVKLDMAHNAIKNLPEMDKFVKLEELYLNNNYLKSLPDFRSCSNLKIVDLDNNELEELPYFPINLENLYLKNNKLTNVDSLFNIKLQVLDLTNNLLTEFPKINDSVRNLLLAWNNIKYVPSLDGYNKLQQLDMNYNIIKCFDDYRLRKPLNLPNLKVLNLHHNYLRCLPDLFFCDKLVDLNVAYNEFGPYSIRYNHDSMKVFTFGEQFKGSHKLVS